MGNPLLPQFVAMDLNGTGTLVDITSYVRGVDGVRKTPVRTDQFRDSGAATFTFTLENYDGRFTPGNTSSPYSNTPTERMAVCWSVGGQLRQGAILSIGLAEDNWTAVTITCDDMLGAASRNTLGDLADTIGRQQSAYFPFSDPAGSVSAAEVLHGYPSMAVGLTGGTVTFGVAASGFVAGTQCEITAPAAAVQSLVSGSIFLQFTKQPSPPQTNALGLVLSTKLLTTYFALSSDSLWGRQIGVQNGFFYYYSLATPGWIATTTPCVPGVQYFVQGIRAGNLWTMYVNGVSVATDTALFFSSGGANTTITVGDASAGASDIVVAEMMFGSTLLNIADAGTTTEAARLTLIDQSTPQLTFAAFPGDLSTAPIGNAATTGQSALDAINTVIRTEQGYIDCVTTGTLTAPTQTIRVRARQRPPTVSYTFDAQQEVSGTIDLVRDSTNLIWSDSVTGANGSSQTVAQTALQSRAGSNNSSDTVAVYRPSDLYEFGTDRLWRGQNVSLRPVSVTIDNVKCPTDRSADLLAMVPGDRIRISNIPSTVVGFTTWDGWLLDKAQTHTSGPDGQDLFTLYLQPCQPATGIYDTDLYANGGNNTISTTLTNVATSMLCTSTDGVTLFETSAVNYYLLVDSEVVKVTACSAPVAGVQTLTITRAQLGTSAAAHAVGVAPEVYADSTARLNNGIFAF